MHATLDIGSGCCLRAVARIVYEETIDSAHGSQQNLWVQCNQIHHHPTCNPLRFIQIETYKYIVSGVSETCSRSHTPINALILFQPHPLTLRLQTIPHMCHLTDPLVLLRVSLHTASFRFLRPSPFFCHTIEAEIRHSL